MQVTLKRYHAVAGELICAIVKPLEADTAEPAGTVPDMSEPMADVVTGYEGPPRKVLVVDDKRDCRMQIDRILRPLGFVLAHAETGLQALDRTEREKPDLVLMDLVMPEMDGLEATRLIRRSGHAELPIIALSSPSFEGLEEKACAAGCDAVITKPVHRRRLLALLARHLELTWICLGEDAVTRR